MPNDESTTNSVSQTQRPLGLEKPASLERSNLEDVNSDKEDDGRQNDAPRNDALASPTLLATKIVNRDEDFRPPLPPRPSNLATDLGLLRESRKESRNSMHQHSASLRPKLQSSATTALSRTDIHTQSFQDGSRETFTASAESTPSTKPSQVFGSIRRIKGFSSSEGGDTASVRSYAPTLEAGGDNESLVRNSDSLLCTDNQT